jgi:hypothetical protein
MYWLGMTRRSRCGGRMSWKTDSKMAPAWLVAPYQLGSTAPSSETIGENRKSRPVRVENRVPVASLETRQSVRPAGHSIVRGAMVGRRVARCTRQSSDSAAW